MMERSNNDIASIPTPLSVLHILENRPLVKYLTKDLNISDSSFSHPAVASLRDYLESRVIAFPSYLQWLKNDAYSAVN